MGRDILSDFHCSLTVHTPPGSCLSEQETHMVNSQGAVVQCQLSEEPTCLYAWRGMNDVTLTLAKDAAL